TGIRAPQSTKHLVTREPRRTLRNPNLAPEEQAGTEVGIDVFFGSRFAVHVTRFDQTASGLIQTVTIVDSARRTYWYQLQNVGEISNRGWESQVTASNGALTVGAAATLVSSRVKRLARGYTGDLQPGDRMIAVPARTISGTMAWNKRGFQLSSTLSRATDWINYDRLALAQALIDHNAS